MYILKEDELAHYGVKGMKWGVRKDPQKKAAKKAAREERKVVRKEARRARSAKKWENRAKVAKDIKKQVGFGESFVIELLSSQAGFWGSLVGAGTLGVSGAPLVVAASLGYGVGSVAGERFVKGLAARRVRKGRPGLPDYWIE